MIKKIREMKNILDREEGDFKLTKRAKVAELADALDLESSWVKPVGVQVPSFAPFLLLEPQLHYKFKNFKINYIDKRS